MQKQSKTVFERSFSNSDFFKAQKEVYLERKKEVDEIGWKDFQKRYTEKDDTMFKDNICYQKAKTVAIEIAKIGQRICEKRDYVILSAYVNQVIRSSSSVFANLSEGAIGLISRRDKANKYRICLKEASETISWVTLLHELGEITKEEAEHLIDELTQIIKILGKSIGTLKKGR